MVPLLRAAVAAHNEGADRAASALIAASSLDEMTVFPRDGAGSTVGDHQLEHTADGLIALDGTIVHADDLELGELIEAVSSIEPTIESHRVDALVAAASHAVERTRLRLLLEDIVFDEAASSVATDRLTRMLEQLHRRDRDVADLFDRSG